MEATEPHNHKIATTSGILFLRLLMPLAKSRNRFGSCPLSIQATSTQFNRKQSIHSENIIPCHGRPDAEHSTRLATTRSYLTLTGWYEAIRTVFKMATLSIVRFLSLLFPN